MNKSGFLPAGTLYSVNINVYTHSSLTKLYKIVKVFLFCFVFKKTS